MFDKIETTPDRDGDYARVTPHDSGWGYVIRVLDADGDFKTAWVTSEDMVTIARAVLAAENQA